MAALGYGLDNRWFESRQRLGIFPPRRPDRFWGPPSLLSNGYQGLFFLGVKRLGSEADYSPSSAEVKNAWSYTSTPPIRLHGVVLCYSNFTLENGEKTEQRK
jgi:hypothetical protein